MAQVGSSRLEATHERCLFSLGASKELSVTVTERNRQSKQPTTTQKQDEARHTELAASNLPLQRAWCQKVAWHVCAR